MEAREELRKLRESTGMNRKEFCEYFEIPYMTETEMMALRIKRRRILDSLPKNEASCQRKYTFWKCILR